jgi:uncharacterized protein YndB with AHSA1/START domain
LAGADLADIFTSCYDLEIVHQNKPSSSDAVAPCREVSVISFRIDVDIDAPRSDVFEALTDLEAAREWMPDLQEIEVLSETRNGEGLRWRETRTMFGREASEVMEVTAYEPPDHIHVFADGTEGSSGRGKYDFDYRLTETDDGTHVALDAEITDMGFFMGLIGKLMKGTFKKAIQKDLNAMKGWLEDGE